MTGGMCCLWLSCPLCWPELTKSLLLARYYEKTGTLVP